MKALVTGASRGIGKAIAQALAREGYEMYLTCDRTFDVLEKTAEEIKNESGVPVHIFRTDMADENEVNRLAEEAGSIDVLVNNAGISYIGLLQDMSSEEWHRLMAVNVDSVFYTCRAFMPQMIRRQSGRIINISSIWGNTGASCEVAYSASKGAVNAFTRALAKELAPSKVTVNAISCGIIDTDMNRCFSDEEIGAFLEEVPAGRMGTPQEIARMAVMLCKAPDYLTGQIITVDGGLQ